MAGQTFSPAILHFEVYVGPARTDGPPRCDEIFDMTTLSLFVAASSFVTIAIARRTGDPALLLLGGARFVCAFATFRSRVISSFLRIFVAIFATETVLSGSANPRRTKLILAEEIRNGQKEIQRRGDRWEA
jgi:hypothetical protein